MSQKKHKIVVEIDCDDTQGTVQAEDRLFNWLETFGYTSVGHGFTFVAVERIVAVASKNKRKVG